MMDDDDIGCIHLLKLGEVHDQRRSPSINRSTFTLEQSMISFSRTKSSRS